MTDLAGLSVRDEQNPHGDIEIEIIGLRPGEKLYEELLIGGEPQPTPHPRIMKSREDFINWDILQDELRTLEMALNINNVSSIRLIMERLVPGYIPSAEIVDWVYAEERT
jgi:FlaA1/EpsC-like NDP-sugar epimerase